MSILNAVTQMHDAFQAYRFAPISENIDDIYRDIICDVYFIASHFLFSLSLPFP